MAKLAQYCCDPRHETPCIGSRVGEHGCEACKDECDPIYLFYGSKVQAEQKLERNKKAAEAEDEPWEPGNPQLYGY